MENSKLLSIIIPAYNVEDYIEQCLDSIFDGMSEEAAKLTEVIVVNDGSADCTGEILKNYRQAGRQAGRQAFLSLLLKRKTAGYHPRAMKE